MKYTKLRWELMHNSLESITKNGRLRELEIGSGN